MFRGADDGGVMAGAMVDGETVEGVSVTFAGLDGIACGAPTDAAVSLGIGALLTGTAEALFEKRKIIKQIDLH